MGERILRPVPLPDPLRAMAREGRLPHALCLEGEPGSGRLALARSLAGAVLCERQGGEMCGECTPCRKVLAGVHSDVLLRDGREDPESFKVRAMRELRAEAYKSPSEGRAKVFILAEAQLLLRESQNVLLKVMEEPPEDTYFILTCDNKYRLLETVRSRLTAFALPPLGEEECLRRLRERAPGKKPEEYREAVLLCRGSPGAGEAILTQPQAGKRARAAGELLSAMAGRDPYGVMAAAAPFEKNRGEYAALLEEAARLAGWGPFLREKGISPARGALLREKLLTAGEKNRQNGYQPLLSALLGMD